MSRYRVTVDTSYVTHSYEEITVEADTEAKAKYKACKIFYGNAFNGGSMKYFITLFHPSVEKVRDDAPLGRIYYAEGSGYDN